jgi:aspartyl/asparaginyl beta-hydroxylase (cupin superfamily)
MGNFDVIESALALQNNLIARFAPLDDDFVNPESLPWTRAVEAETDSVLAELSQLLNLHVGLPSMASLSDRQEGMGGTSWQSFVFRMFGNEVPTSAVLCPKTFDLVNGIDEIDTAMFSVLQPGAEIEAHSGPSKAELRYHLPLIVPTADSEICGLRVGATTDGWEVGRSVVFDDTVDHQAWNRSDAIRVVLFIGCRRPMPTPMAQIIDRLTRIATKGHPDVMEILEKAEIDNRRIVGNLMQR